MHITLGGIDYNYDDALSHRDFSGRDVSSIEFRNKVIYSSNFEAIEPGTAVFAADERCVLLDCEVSNVELPHGVQLILVHRRPPVKFRPQKDKNDWEVDDGGKPIRPRDWTLYAKFGVPIPEAKDIPKEEVKESTDYLRGEKLKRGLI